MTHVQDLQRAQYGPLITVVKHFKQEEISKIRTKAYHLEKPLPDIFVWPEAHTLLLDMWFIIYVV